MGQKIEIICDCPKLLIVDDSETNIFVLTGFCNIENIKFDIVFFPTDSKNEFF